MDNSVQEFEWAQIGDIAKGRPTLGTEMNVAVYRMFHFSIRNVIEKSYGKDAAKLILAEAGRISGSEFCKNLLDITLPPDKFFDLLRQEMEELKMGILNIELADFENMIFVLTVSEDLDCSGVPVTGETICNYDEGLITGILEVYTGKQFMVREIDCWSAGQWTCRFNIVSI